MPDQKDRTLIEGARMQRMRLGSAMLYGRLDERRTVNDNVRRVIGSIVVAALACAVCVGISFVSDLLQKQAAEKAKQQGAAVELIVQQTAIPDSIEAASGFADPLGGAR